MGSKKKRGTIADALVLPRGGPEAVEPALRAEWLEARRRIIDHLLRLVSGSRWRDHLVLRGSVLLTAWLGDAARDPGDIDWVFRTAEEEPEGPQARRFSEWLLQAVYERPWAGRAWIDAGRTRVDRIWEYAHAPGRRFLFPWEVEGLPSGAVQMDVVFGEELFSEPVVTEVPSPDGGGVAVWSADKNLSLAWKLRWLETDRDPKGKDLYDATLLAEQTYLPPHLLHRVLTSTGIEYFVPNLNPDPTTWYIDWAAFKAESPEVEGEAKEWQARLAAALNLAR
jgi:hypothetical protein